MFKFKITILQNVYWGIIIYTHSFAYFPDLNFSLDNRKFKPSYYRYMYNYLVNVVQDTGYFL